MRRMKDEINRTIERIGCERGQDLVEYALLAGFLAVAGGSLIPWAAKGPLADIFSKVGSVLFKLTGT
jgi:Flp pilus assembly pilin Flp